MDLVSRKIYTGASIMSYLLQILLSTGFIRDILTLSSRFETGSTEFSFSPDDQSRTSFKNAVDLITPRKWTESKRTV